MTLSTIIVTVTERLKSRNGGIIMCEAPTCLAKSREITNGEKAVSKVSRGGAGRAIAENRRHHARYRRQHPRYFHVNCWESMRL
jgi:hypothetical protein